MKMKFSNNFKKESDFNHTIFSESKSDLIIVAEYIEKLYFENEELFNNLGYEKNNDLGQVYYEIYGYDKKYYITSFNFPCDLACMPSKVKDFYNWYNGLKKVKCLDLRQEKEQDPEDYYYTEDELIEELKK